MARLVELSGLSRSFREGERVRRVLDGVELRVEEGEFVALVGPSGSGKSTLINVIAAIDRPDAGDVRIGGIAVHALREPARTLFRREHIGLVFQFFNLIETLTVLENVVLPLQLAGRKDGEARARALLERVGLADRTGSFPDVLSGGEQQRVAIARALVTEPDLVLLDEPTGNLDEENANAVLDLLEDLRRERTRTILMATHSADAAARADRVVALHGGHVEEAT